MSFGLFVPLGYTTQKSSIFTCKMSLVLRHGLIIINTADISRFYVIDYMLAYFLLIRDQLGHSDQKEK